MTEGEKTKKYREEATIELIENYRDLIKKTFDVTDKDLLQTQIDEEDPEDSEKKYLDAIKRRRVALDEVDVMLDKIEKLEKNLNGEEDTGNALVSTNPAKKFSKK